VPTPKPDAAPDLTDEIEADVRALQDVKDGMESLIVNADAARRLVDTPDEEFNAEMDHARAAIRELEDAERMLKEITEDLSKAKPSPQD
jgi:soluble cytochrome b562